MNAILLTTMMVPLISVPPSELLPLGPRPEPNTASKSDESPPPKPIQPPSARFETDGTSVTIRDQDNGFMFIGYSAAAKPRRVTGMVISNIQPKRITIADEGFVEYESGRSIMAVGSAGKLVLVKRGKAKLEQKAFDLPSFNGIDPVEAFLALAKEHPKLTIKQFASERRSPIRTAYRWMGGWRSKGEFTPIGTMKRRLNYDRANEPAKRIRGPRTIVDRPSDSDADAFVRAAAHNRSEEVIQWLEQGVDVNVTDQFGKTALNRAVFFGHEQTVKLLLERGADVTRSDKSGDPPIHVAVERNRLDSAEILLASGADVNALNSRGYTPLYQAVQSGDVDMVDKLVKHGAKPDQLCRQTTTALHAAVARDAVDAIKRMGPFAMRIDVRDSLQRTPLHYAAELNREAIVEALLTHSPDITLKNKDGDTADDIARKKGALPIRYLLLLHRRALAKQSQAE